MPLDQTNGVAATSTEMTCQELVELVTDYLDMALDPETERRFEEHLVECPYCPAYVEQMRLTIVALGAITPDDLPPATREALLAHFRSWSSGR